jgi:hypothetical protein
MGISRTTCQYKKKVKDDSEVQDALSVLTTKHAAIGLAMLLPVVEQRICLEP